MHYDVETNLRELLRQIQGIQDYFQNIVFMVDPMSMYTSTFPFYEKIRPVLEKVKATTFPKLIIMDSHLSVFENYSNLELRYYCRLNPNIPLINHTLKLAENLIHTVFSNTHTQKVGMEIFLYRVKVGMNKISIVAICSYPV